MDDLAQFLRARYHATAVGALAATRGPWTVDNQAYAESISAADATVVVGGGRWGSEASVFESTADAIHIAEHDPQHVLADLDAKQRRLARHTPERRRLSLTDADGTTSMAFLICTWCTPNRVIHRAEQDIVEWPCPDLLDDAAVYADHPDYRDMWRP
ncbi:DUF6221 family protein [Streptomyces sp. IBSNAI002]|uniref:DUF6221 family protein n=1 Tax=Streptomyces sp. IBSNAI002 TaxID=3457500 RepID=UPI003FD26E77